MVDLALGPGIDAGGRVGAASCESADGLGSHGLWAFPSATALAALVSRLVVLARLRISALIVVSSVWGRRTRVEVPSTSGAPRSGSVVKEVEASAGGAPAPVVELVAPVTGLFSPSFLRASSLSNFDSRVKSRLERAEEVSVSVPSQLVGSDGGGGDGGGDGGGAPDELTRVAAGEEVGGATPGWKEEKAAL